jgi:hypothetical protein
MPNYRIYFLDAAGRIASATEVDCDTNEDALAAAKRQLDADAFAEVWQLGRCLGTACGDHVSNQ